MKPGHDDPAHWRMLAAEVRAQAGAMHDPQARRKMLDVAEAYEQMAVAAEEHQAGLGKREGKR